MVQGRTRPEPLEIRVFAAPHHRSLHIDPPGEFAQTCNIAYPRELLERLGGFDETLVAVGEDLDLALRAGELGADYVGAKEALVFHSVESYSLPAVIRLNFRWQHVPDVVRRHPQLRRRHTLGIFWRRSNFELCLAATGVAGCQEAPTRAPAGAPLPRSAVNARGPGKRARLASTVELPGRIVADGMEVAALAKGSARYRTLVL